MERVYALLVGIAMGALLQRVGASSPRMILRSLRLEDLTIIKFMATTIAVGMLLVYTLNVVMPQQLHFDVKPLYVAGVLVGGLVFGAGFALGGYCPGTCVVGAGEGRKDAWFAILGGVAGALLFVLAFGALDRLLMRPLDLGPLRLHDVLPLSPLAAAVLLGALMLIAVALLPTVRKAGGAAPPAAGR